MSKRWDELQLLREAYPTFGPFLYDVMTDLMGFQCSDIQLDIANYLEYGPTYRMIQAQRGQAKTTITAAYAVWRGIHNPAVRVLIISAGGNMAKEISNWVIQIVMGMDILECMRPDRSSGDRASVEGFDFHHELKGPEKSPSVACIGITGNLQGKRADVLIADDVESAKNSQTDLQRERLRHLTKDFASINSSGDIIYLGTPQSIDSIYNGLPGRGYNIRIWPGRYPTIKELENYGAHLAPLIAKRIADDPSLQSGGGPLGTRGQATDPILMSEEKLTKKEIDQGAAYFQLQHMLDTRLSDNDRFPLKTASLVFSKIAASSAPISVNYVASDEHRILPPNDFPLDNDRFYRAAGFGQEFAPFSGTYMYVDPAGGGQNGDETAYAVTKFSAGTVYLVDAGGVPGGLGLDSLNELTAIAAKWKPDEIGIEDNFGKGALSHVWQPILFKQHRCGVEDIWVTGRKELRIIDILEPVINTNRLIVEESLIDADWKACQKYPVEKRASYSLFFQLARITRQRDCLSHDDRLDALAGSVKYWVDHLQIDSDKAVVAARKDQYNAMMKNPLGNGRPVPGYKGMYGLRSTALSRMRRNTY